MFSVVPVVRSLLLLVLVRPSCTRCTRARPPCISPRRGITLALSFIRNRRRRYAEHTRARSRASLRGIARHSARRAHACVSAPAQQRRAIPQSVHAMAAAAFIDFLRGLDGADGKEESFIAGIANILERNGLSNPGDLAGSKFEDLNFGPSGTVSAAAKAHLRRVLDKANPRDVRRQQYFACPRVPCGAAAGGARCGKRERAPGCPRATPARVIAVDQQGRGTLTSHSCRAGLLYARRPAATCS